MTPAEQNSGEYLNMDTKASLGIINFFTNFPAYARTNLSEGLSSCPLWFLVLWIIGSGASIDRIVTKVVTTDGSQYAALGWPVIWGIIWVLGPLSGIFVYGLQGGVFHLLVRLSGGGEGFSTSANSFIYSRIPLYLVLIASTVLETFLYGAKYFEGYSEPTLDSIILVLTLGGILFAIINCWRSAKINQGVKPVRGVIFLLVLPATLYLVIFGVLIVGPAMTSNYDSLNQKGIAAYQDGNPELAISHYDSALRKVPNLYIEDKLSILGNKALALIDLGRTEEVIQTYEEGLKLSVPGSMEAHVFRGSIALIQNDVKLAIEHFQQVLEIDENDYRGHNELGLIFLGEYDPAFTDLDRALVHNQKAKELSSDFNLELNYGRNLYLLERYGEAEVEFLGLMNQYDSHPYPYVFLGYIYVETEQYRESIPVLEKAMELYPDLRSGDVGEYYNEARRHLGLDPE